VKPSLDGQVNSLLELFRMNEPTGLGDEEEPARAGDSIHDPGEKDMKRGSTRLIKAGLLLS
jgi:hypothetical protein